ncbi:uncharacterized protein P174DRAFT_426260 [Aspergillus novofumigatus IBT 16806]|uniref:Phosphotransferase enzyme family protein n=1 Tax=Aspergillus novofumigatus (strain IBT 16806) TaxID=1392255 RepID=A0A2I1CJU9_ASPN1|nr:uncharacterized protein P174DRAFT_426260 [Aspergillus novofumigatus IBT 16806]PKX97902.1 hypothetical protein P174DRAFT_426260 [Aspergillus novofumigatus IBT 16806]
MISRTSTTCFQSPDTLDAFQRRLQNLASTTGALPKGDSIEFFSPRSVMDSRPIAKVPYQIAGPTQYATVSEAATLQYLHSKGSELVSIFTVDLYGKPVQLGFPHNGVFPGEKFPEDYLCLLDKYLTLAQYLLPDEPDNPLDRPTLRHPACNGRAASAGCWPFPRAFENPDPEQTPELNEPSLPLDYESLSAHEKAEADILYRRRLLFYYYRIFNGHFNKAHLEALRDPILLPRQHLVDRAGRQWNGNPMTLKRALVRTVEYWPHLPDTKGLSCPVQFTGAELEGFHEQEQRWFDLNKFVNHWRDQIGGVNKDGWTSNEQYE